MLFPTTTAARHFESIFGTTVPAEENTYTNGGGTTIVIGEGSTPAASAAAVAMSKLTAEQAQQYMSLITQNAPTTVAALPPTPAPVPTETFITADQLNETLAGILNLQDLRTLKVLKKRELKAASAIIMAAKTTSTEITAEMSKLEAAYRKVDAATTECEVEAVTL
jgi:hypothetical protein